VMAGLGCLVLATQVATLALLAASASAGALSVGALTVIVQGLFGMSMIASMKGDTWIENGAVPLPDVLALEQSLLGLPQPVPHRESSRAATDRLPAESISFDQVSFGYPGGGELILDRLNLRIQAGTSLAIVGLNGAGKTTLVKLLSGLCRPTAGTVTVDGTDLTRLEVASWRRQLAVIFQDFVRYEMPLRDNIVLGSVERSWADSAVRQIAELAGAGELLAALPAGASTVLSPRFAGGVDLSGGQWQRIAFARALLATRGGARVLVMDEPTAHLDVRAEAEFYASFLDLTRGLTTIVISHRFSTVRRADRIVVLEHGRITEDGSHSELLDAGGQYARLFRLQASNYASGAHD
jgi:ATP-binding cassette, subfamily B, bacterial